MKKFLPLCLLLLPIIAHAQITSSTARRVRAGSSLPATCKATNPVDVFIRTGATNPGFYICSATNTWSGPFSTSTGITNSATNGQVAISNGTNIVGDADLTFATDTLTATKVSSTQVSNPSGVLTLISQSQGNIQISNGNVLMSGDNRTNGNHFFGFEAYRAARDAVIGFSSSDAPVSAGNDSGFSRLSAGVIGVGTGAQGNTAGQLNYTVGQLQPLTVATLPSGTAGMYAYVTDGDAGLAWGATVVNTGAGATKYLVWFNGTNWTVAGK